MKRILLAKFNHEVGSFNPQLTYYDDFTIHRGPDLLEATRSSNSTLAGNIDILEARSRHRTSSHVRGLVQYHWRLGRRSRYGASHRRIVGRRRGPRPS